MTAKTSKSIKQNLFKLSLHIQLLNVFSAFLFISEELMLDTPVCTRRLCMHFLHCVAFLKSLPWLRPLTFKFRSFNKSYFIWLVSFSNQSKLFKNAPQRRKYMRIPDVATQLCLDNKKIVDRTLFCCVFKKE